MQDSNDNELGLYVHVPFCSTTCDFCAFYQERPSKKGFEEYFLALEKDFQAHLPDRPFPRSLLEVGLRVFFRIVKLIDYVP